MTPPSPWDGETQPERTVLSWQRTGLGVMAVAALLGHRAVRTGRPALLVLAGGVALIGLGVLGVLAPARRRQLGRVPDGAAAPRSMTALTAAVVLVALAVAGAVLSPP